MAVGSQINLVGARVVSRGFPVAGSQSVFVGALVASRGLPVAGSQAGVVDARVTSCGFIWVSYALGMCAPNGGQFPIRSCRRPRCFPLLPIVSQWHLPKLGSWASRCFPLLPDGWFPG